MQREIQKPPYLPSVAKSSQAKPFVQPNLNVTRSIKTATKQRRNERQQQLLSHLETIVDVQEMLLSLSTTSPDSEIIQDFAFGLRGAPQLSHSEFQILTTFRRLITSSKHPKTVADFILNMPHEANQKAAEHFKWLLEGRKMLAEGTNISYYDGQSLISRILRSGYFSQIRLNNAKMNSQITLNEIQTGRKQPGQTKESPSTANHEGIDNLLANITTQLEETNRII